MASKGYVSDRSLRRQAKKKLLKIDSNDTPQPICEFQVRFLVQWIRKNQDKHFILSIYWNKCFWLTVGENQLESIIRLEIVFNQGHQSCPPNSKTRSEVVSILCTILLAVICASWKMWTKLLLSNEHEMLRSWSRRKCSTQKRGPSGLFFHETLLITMHLGALEKINGWRMPGGTFLALSQCVLKFPLSCQWSGI